MRRKRGGGSFRYRHRGRRLGRRSTGDYLSRASDRARTHPSDRSASPRSPNPGLCKYRTMYQLHVTRIPRPERGAWENCLNGLAPSTVRLLLCTAGRTAHRPRRSHRHPSWEACSISPEERLYTLYTHRPTADGELGPCSIRVGSTSSRNPTPPSGASVRQVPRASPA